MDGRDGTERKVALFVFWRVVSAYICIAAGIAVVIGMRNPRGLVSVVIGVLMLWYWRPVQKMHPLDDEGDAFLIDRFNEREW